MGKMILSNDKSYKAFLLHSNSSSKLDSKKLGSLLRSLGYTVTDSNILELIDSHKLITYEEFIEIEKRVKLTYKITIQELRDAFLLFDVNNNGKIKSEILREILIQNCLSDGMKEDEVEEIMKDVEVDGDGNIVYEQFIKMCCSD